MVARAPRRLRAGHHVGNGDVRVERRLGLEGALGRAGRAGLARLGLARTLRGGDRDEPVVSHSLGARAETNALGVEVILGNRETRGRAGGVRRGEWGGERRRCGGGRASGRLREDSTRPVEKKILGGTADEEGERTWIGVIGVGGGVRGRTYHVVGSLRGAVEAHLHVHAPSLRTRGWGGGGIGSARVASGRLVGGARAERRHLASEVETSHDGEIGARRAFRGGARGREDHARPPGDRRRRAPCSPPARRAGTAPGRRRFCRPGWRARAAPSTWRVSTQPPPRLPRCPRRGHRPSWAAAGPNRRRRRSPPSSRSRSRWLTPRTRADRNASAAHARQFFERCSPKFVQAGPRVT